MLRKVGYQVAATAGWAKSSVPTSARLRQKLLKKHQMATFMSTPSGRTTFYASQASQARSLRAARPLCRTFSSEAQVRSIFARPEGLLWRYFASPMQFHSRYRTTDAGLTASLTFYRRVQTGSKSSQLLQRPRESISSQSCRRENRPKPHRPTPSTRC